MLAETLGPETRDWIAEEFWRGLEPTLSISTALAPEARANGPEAAALARARERMLTEGYFSERDETLRSLAPQLADAVGRLVSSGIPAPFIFVYDQAWTCFHRMSTVLADLLGPDYRVLPDFWAWHVDPAKEQAGWRPHRDKDLRAIASDGSPLSLTVWIPLSDANPLNGCMYILPANRDPAYGRPIATADIDLPNIRALPGSPGDVFVWNQAVFHWGARSSRFGDRPRISMAMEFQRGDAPPFNRLLLPPLTALSFQDRLRLIAYQIVQYRHMYPLSEEVAAFAKSVLGSQSAAS